MGVADPRLAALRRNYVGPNGTATPINGSIAHAPVTMPHVLMRQAANGSGRPGRLYAVDSLFPHTLRGTVDTASVDEGSADLLYGLVRALQPQVVLETGTHKGRSTRAIVSALWANARQVISPLVYTAYLPLGHCYTVDAEDYGIRASGAIPPEMHEAVTPLIGWTPDVFMQPPLDTLTGIDFAFLDGDHTGEGLDAELTYVDLHRAPECWVAIDNSRDVGWPAIARLLHGYTKYPRVSLGTCTGLDLIWMRDSPAPVSGRNGQTPE
jgi:hypothetical protein